MTALPHSEEHRVTGTIRHLRELLRGVAEAPVWSMSAADTGEALVLLSQARSQLDSVLFQVLRHSDVVGTGQDQGSNAVSWWAHTTRTTRAEAHRTSGLAAALERHERVAAALGVGDLRTDQARAIVGAVDGLPDEVEGWVRVEATDFLLDKASHHDAKSLRILGRRLLEVVDPEAADAEESRRLEAEERDARAKASFTMSDDGHGRCHGRFSIPTLHGEMLRKHLMALASPGRQRSEAAAGAHDLPLGRHRMGQAFTDYIERRSDDVLPSSGGVAATVVVTMELSTLVGGLKAAALDTGGRISAGEARRLACRAGIIPLVLDGPSVVLDAGRRRRFHSETQRIAMGVRDGGCTAAGCDFPPGLCQAHHDQVPWSKNGGTSVELGRLLCPRHHRRMHDPAFQHSLDKHGKVRFTRRT